MAVVDKLVFPERLITLSDLEQVKAELLTEIASLLKGDAVQPENKWLKSKEVKKFLNISPGTLQSLRVKGILPFTKIGGMMYYSSNEVNNIMTAKK